MAVKKKIKSTVTRADLDKKYPGSGLVVEMELDPDEMLWVPSSSPAINYRMGGGLAYGRICEIAGKESSGKTLLALNFIRSAQKMSGIGILIDAEFAFNAPWARRNGLDTSLIHLYEENELSIISDFMVEIAFYYRAQLTHNEPIVLVLDSVAAVDTKENMENSELDHKAEMGNRAKALYRMLRLRNKYWAKLGICVVFINQLRDTIKIGFGAQFGDKDESVGGKAFRFYASQRLFLETKKVLTRGKGDNKHRYGAEVNLVMKKNKLAPPKVPHRFAVIFDDEYGTLGFDRYTGLDKAFLKLETVTKKGNSFYFDGECIATSKKEFIEVIEDDKDLRGDLLRESGIPTISTMKRRLKKIKENRYPAAQFDIKQAKKEADKDDEEDEDE